MKNLEGRKELVEGTWMTRLRKAEMAVPTNRPIRYRVDQFGGGESKEV